MILPKIIFEDKFLLVLDKPPGMVVNKAETVGKILTVQDWISKYLRIRGKGIGNRAGIIHRLDKDTSGILLVAKTQDSFANIQRQFKNREVEKKYLALVHGEVSPEKSVIRGAISRNPFDKKKFGIFLGGKEAETEYKTLKQYSAQKMGSFSLLELTPKTGRTHQIRVHLKFIGYPVVGDEKYAGRKTLRQDRRWCSRQFLHASAISFKHPKTGEKIEFSLGLPPDLKKALKTLQEQPKALN